MSIPLTSKGFIDLHTHGFGKYDTRSSDPVAILKMAEAHGNAGTRAILPTVYPGPVEKMRADIEAVRKAMEIQKTSPRFPFARGGSEGSEMEQGKAQSPALILGVHLEGPFLNPARCGALDKRYFIMPSLSSLKRLICGYEKIVRILTIAPEMPGALRVIEKCANAGIRVNMGHSDATYRRAEEGKKAGASGVTHIFNAMGPFHHREPGLAGFGLMDNDTYVEVIADGFHLCTEALALIFRVKDEEKIVLVSDSVRGAGKGRPLCKTGGGIAGSGMALSGSIGVLIRAGVSGEKAMAAGTLNPERYLSC